MAANYQIWPCKAPLWEMPPEFGDEFLSLCRSLQPMAWVLLERLAAGQER